jgi:hypothetical protein
MWSGTKVEDLGESLQKMGKSVMLPGVSDL